MIETDPEFLALMAACRDRPADDAPRLILSDWLEEHDEDAWAELIRVECKLERTPTGDQQLALRDRSDTLIYKCWSTWFGGLISILDRLPGGSRITFHRDARSQHYFELLRRVNRKYEWMQFARHLDPRTPLDLMWSDRGLPALWIRWDSLRAPPVQAWFASPKAGRLWRTHAVIGASDERLPVGSLGVSPGLRPSLALSLIMHNSRREAKSALPPLTQSPDADPRRPTHVGTLNDALAQLNDSAFARQDFRSVTRLELSSPSDMPPLGPLLSSVDCSRLVHFSSGEAAGDVTLGLLRNQMFDSLEEMTLRCIDHPAVGDALAAAAEAGRLPRLRKLFTTCQLGEDVYRRLTASACGRTLSWLHFRDTGLTAPGLRGVIDCGLLDRMAREAACPHEGEAFTLDLADNPLGDDGAKALGADPLLERVTALDLSNTGLGDDGLAALLGSPHLSRQIALNISRNKVTDVGGDLLLESNVFEPDAYVSCHCNNVSYVVERALEGKFRSYWDWKLVPHD